MKVFGFYARVEGVHELSVSKFESGFGDSAVFKTEQIGWRLSLLLPGGKVFGLDIDAHPNSGNTKPEYEAGQTVLVTVAPWVAPDPKGRTHNTGEGNDQPRPRDNGSGQAEVAARERETERNAE